MVPLIHTTLHDPALTKVQEHAALSFHPTLHLATTPIPMTGNDADLSRLFQSNEIPNSAQNPAIQAQLHSLGSQISALRQRLRELEGHERAYRALASLVRLLPLEVLGEIFTLSVATGDGRINHQAVVEAGLVCKHWREASLLDHRLWCNLSLSVTGDKPSLNKVVSWLCRSGSLAKSMDFFVWHRHHNNEAAEECKNCAEVLTNILTHGPLLHKITLSMELPECYDCLFKALDTHQSSTSRPWDHVDSLAIHIREGRGRTAPYFPDLPPVTSFKLGLPEMDETFPHPVACEKSDLGLSPQFINRLTHLAITIDWTINHLISILQQCSSLEELTVNFRTQAVMYPSENPVPQAVIHDGVRLPRVRKVHLEYADVDSLSILLLLRIPNIRHLEVDFSTFDTAIPFYLLDQVRIDQYWVPFGHRHTNLQSIRISNGTIAPGTTVKAMFIPLPSLTHLTFDQVVFESNALFHDVSVPMVPDDKLFPKLETLELLNVDAADFDLEPVFSFLGAPLRRHYSSTGNWRPLHANLKKLEITFRQVVCTTDNSSYAWDNALARKGVDVRVGPRHFAD